MISRNILFVLLFAAASISLTAQKFGHLNSQQLLLEVPEIKSANSQLEAYQNQLITKGEGMVKTFEANYKAYIDEANEGNLSKLEIQKRESALGLEQQGIQKYELEVQQLLAKKREVLYKPILDRVKSVVDQVGKDNGYTMIFDSSTGMLLHAMDSEDVIPLVRSKLGI